MSIRVLVADDQDLVRTGLRLILGTLDGIEVVGEARDGQEAVRLARELRPDVCLMDIRMPVLDGVEATRQLAGPGVEDPVAVVVITTFDLDEYVHGALLAGAIGFLLKDAGPELLGEAIRAATRGDSLISPSITRRLLSTFAGTGRAAPPAQPLDPLTEREEQVLLTIARGRTNAEIAAELHISLSTVKTHIASLMAKLGARNRVEVAMWGYETGRVREQRPASSAGRKADSGELSRRVRRERTHSGNDFLHHAQAAVCPGSVVRPVLTFTSPLLVVSHVGRAAVDSWTRTRPSYECMRCVAVL